jgi:hypothetical protein
VLSLKVDPAMKGNNTRLATSQRALMGKFDTDFWLWHAPLRKALRPLRVVIRRRPLWRSDPVFQVIRGKVRLAPQNRHQSGPS